MPLFYIQSTKSSGIFAVWDNTESNTYFEDRLRLNADEVEQLKDLASKGKSTKTAALDYDRKPDFMKRSTGELVARVCYLLDLQDYSKNTKQGDFKDPVSKKGVTEELKQIKSALVDRGFDKEELSMLGLGN